MRFLFIVLISFCSSAYAQHSGDVDVTFGYSGFINYDILGLGYDDDCKSAIVTATGDLICAGYASDFSGVPQQRCGIIRLMSDGNLDPTFGNNGKTTSSFGVHSIAKDIKLHPNGNIIVAGDVLVTYSNTDFFIASYLPSGEIDSSFGTNGVTIIDMGNEMDVCCALSIQNDGKMIVAGSNSIDYVMVRFETNGTIDSSFGNNGKVNLSFFQNGMFLDVLVTTDGSIYSVGGIYFPSSGSHNYLITKCLSNGEVDVNFGNNGSVNYGLTNYSELAYCITQVDDSTIAVGGTYGNSYNTSGVGVFVSKINLDGEILSSFGNNGLVHIPVAQNDYFDMTKDSLNNIYCITGQNSVIPDEYIIKTLNNGSIDTSFGNNGTVYLNYGYYGRRIIVYNDKLYLFAAYHVPSSVQTDFGICRLNLFTGTIVSEKNQNNVQLFPNPTSGKIQFRIKQQNEGSVNTIYIYNCFGQKVKPNSIHNNYSNGDLLYECDVSNLNNGVYFMVCSIDQSIYSTFIIDK